MVTQSLPNCKSGIAAHLLGHVFENQTRHLFPFDRQNITAREASFRKLMTSIDSTVMS